MCGLSLQHGLNTFGLSLQNVLDKCVVCLCNMAGICSDMRTCLPRMVWLNVSFVSPRWLGYMCGFSLPKGSVKYVFRLSNMVWNIVWLLSPRWFGYVWMNVWFVSTKWFGDVRFVSTKWFGCITCVYMCSLSLQNGLDIFGCLYEMFWINVWLVSATWFEYVWQNVLDKCVVCLCNMAWICLDMRTCLPRMVWLNVWFVLQDGWDTCVVFRYQKVRLNVFFVFPTWFGILCGLSLPDGLDMFGWMFGLSLQNGSEMCGLSLQNGLDALHVYTCAACLYRMVWIYLVVSTKCFG